MGTMDLLKKLDVANMEKLGQWRSGDWEKKNQRNSQ